MKTLFSILSVAINLVMSLVALVFALVGVVLAALQLLFGLLVLGSVGALIVAAVLFLFG